MVKSSPPDRSDRRLAFLLFALTLALDLRLLAPGLLPGDPGEFQFAAWRWGLAHPTGYPLYLLVGGLWQRLLAPLGVSPALALNALSAFFGAAAVALLYWLVRRWLTGPALAVRAAAALSAAFLAANPTFWSQSLIAEVYTLHALLVLSVLLAAQQIEIAGSTQRRRLLLAFLLGLSLAHHGMTLLLLPGLALFLWLVDRSAWRSWRTWFFAALALALPLLFYLYIPLRGGPEASPWLHQRLGEGVLTLYDGGRRAFIDFVTGRAISVGFHDLADALAQVPTALHLWRLHFLWPGLLLAGLGLVVLMRRGRWPVLALTGTYLALQALFNLFYAIGDILVYYIPLYLIAAIWIGFAAAAIAGGHFGRDEETALASSGADAGALQPGLILVLLLFLLPARLVVAYAEHLDQSGSTAAGTAWEAVLAAQPPGNALLVSNDRNEIVPLFYLQAVEGRGGGLTGLFPLMAPDARFADLGATIETALEEGGDQPVYLIKEMPGLETRFRLEPAAPPLVQVMGSAASGPPEHAVERSLGPLTLLGYDWQPQADGVQVDLHWQVEGPLAGNYTTTVQLFDAAGAKIGQDDRRAGGDYYPTALWKPGERLLDRHLLALPPAAQPARLLVGMYRGPALEPLAAPLELEVLD